MHGDVPVLLKLLAGAEFLIRTHFSAGCFLIQLGPLHGDDGWNEVKDLLGLCVAPPPDHGVDGGQDGAPAVEGGGNSHLGDGDGLLLHGLGLVDSIICNKI